MICDYEGGIVSGKIVGCAVPAHFRYDWSDFADELFGIACGAITGDSRTTWRDGECDLRVQASRPGCELSGRELHRRAEGLPARRAPLWQ